MFCENCGKELKENAKFCDECGAKVTIVPPSAVPSEPEVQENVYTQNTSQPEAQQPQQGWQDQSAVQDSPQPQQGWQDQSQSGGFGAGQGGPQPQQNWQNQNAPQGSGDLKEQFMTILGLGNPVSGMSIGALVLTLLCCGLVGVILAIVDIVNDKDHTQNHLLSVIAIAIAIIGFLAGFSGGAAAVLGDSIGSVF